MKKESKVENDVSDTSLKMDWKMEIISVLSSAVSGIKSSIVNVVQDQVEQTKEFIVRQMVILFFLLSGVLFLMVGVADLLNQVIGMGRSPGYLLIGSLCVVLAAFMHILKK